MKLLSLKFLKWEGELIKIFSKLNFSDLFVPFKIFIASNLLVGFEINLPPRSITLSAPKTISPNFMIRYAPSHMRNLSDDDVYLNYSNLYATNKTSEIEEGLSAVLGFDFKTNQKDINNNEKEKLSL